MKEIIFMSVSELFNNCKGKFMNKLIGCNISMKVKYWQKFKNNVYEYRIHKLKIICSLDTGSKITSDNFKYTESKIIIYTHHDNG